MTWRQKKKQRFLEYPIFLNQSIMFIFFIKNIIMSNFFSRQEKLNLSTKWLTPPI
jgi:hypothetical protein